MAASVARHVRGMLLPKPFLLSRLSFVAHIQTYKCCRYFCAATLPDRLYSDKHEWVLPDDKIAIVGVTNYAQDALGDVVFAQLPEVGAELKALEECGTLESVKAASELYSPVSGKVIEKNTLVEEKPSLINTSCYDKGWLFKIELSNPKELDALMNQEQYSKYVKAQS